ncbi:MAM and LDL-receptor class A domain-containing protein 1-like, partial [Anneissia japonica]|uniref:MAM and LDL-receptor class A domain-containing protein 1-like n=1 Tax=Anneissia japonica TaxID=1529436 RepID=UPI001425B616
FYIYADGSFGETVRDDIAKLYTWISRGTQDCQMRFWYQIMGAGTSSLHVILEYSAVKKEVWMQLLEKGQQWTEANVYIGRGLNFSIVIQARRTVNHIGGGISIDDVRLINCNQSINITDECAPSEMTCSNKQCIDLEQVCDYGNDCGDFSDEAYCEGYPATCDFEVDFCDWRQVYNDDLDWIIKSTKTSSYYIGSGPITSDHTLKIDYGHYIQASSGENGTVARLESSSIKMLSKDCE